MPDSTGDGLSTGDSLFGGRKLVLPSVPRAKLAAVT